MLDNGGSRLTTAAVATWAGFAAALGLRVGGGELPAAVVLLLAAAAAFLALACAVCKFAWIWRGPPLVSFTRDDAEFCSPDDADVIRRAAQLRGTMGGAGHLYPRRLAVPALAWLVAAGVAGAAAANRGETPGFWPVVSLVVAAAGTTMFPARPFYYREVNGGGVLVSPPLTAARLGVRGTASESAAALLGLAGGRESS